MPAWNELLSELESHTEEEAANKWLADQIDHAFGVISAERGGSNVILYASSFLQKPTVPAYMVQITHEDINGFMSVMKGMDWSKPLTLILHTPGGITNATETVVEYLHEKFGEIEVIVPTFAMSAGTMISLAANRIILGRQSQLGPIDPQLPLGGRFYSARAVVDQFRRARREILKDLSAAHVWAPILATVGPALLLEAENALAYGEKMVAGWLKKRMFKGRPNASKLAASAARHFNDARSHKSHGRRIGRDEARKKQLTIEDLEDSSELQDAVLTVYHLATILFEKGPAAKLMLSHHGRRWVKNIALPPPQR